LFAVYGYGTLAVFVICMVPLLGLVIIKFQRSSAYKYLLVVMLGLAVGSLTGDVFLHLLPQVSQLPRKRLNSRISIIKL
jgi:ZIP Zinc transporter